MQKSNWLDDLICEIIQEQMLASTVFGSAADGSHGGEVPGGSDFYAKNDMRIPKILGMKKKKGTHLFRRGLTKM